MPWRELPIHKVGEMTILASGKKVRGTPRVPKLAAPDEEVVRHNTKMLGGPEYQQGTRAFTLHAGKGIIVAVVDPRTGRIAGFSGGREALETGHVPVTLVRNATGILPPLSKPEYIERIVPERGLRGEQLAPEHLHALALAVKAFNSRRKRR